MYHPSRGGVRGGSDEFSWDSVKSDKHRENYLGHSVMAPVGRWQKGKDLSWYAKERNVHNSTPTEKSKQLTAIKRAEEDAMLVALGLKSAEKETKSLAKEDVASVLKRNTAEHDNKNVERIGGIGIESGRMAMLTNSNKQTEGVTFENFQKSSSKMSGRSNNELSAEKKRSKPCKKLKKEKKKYSEHKHKKKKKKRSSSLEMSDVDIQRRKKIKRHHSHHTR